MYLEFLDTPTFSTVSTVMAKQLLAEKELNKLLKSTSEICVGLTEKRTRRQTKDPNAAYFEAVRAQSLDAGLTGGLVKGSAHHYDRDFF